MSGVRQSSLVKTLLPFVAYLTFILYMFHFSDLPI